MINRSEHIDEASLAGLHPYYIKSRAEILELLEQVLENGIQLSRGLNHRADLEIAHIDSIAENEVALSTSGFRRKGRRQIFLNFSIGGQPYFFASEATSRFEGNSLRIALPTRIYSAERRDRNRRRPSASRDRAQLLIQGDGSISARIEDVSPGGFGISVKTDEWKSRWRKLQLRYRDHEGIEKETHASVRSQTQSRRSGWTRIGLSESDTETQAPIEPEVWTSLKVASQSLEEIGGHHHLPARQAELVTFPDIDGRLIAGFLDQWGEQSGATSVILHTGWGETKETLLPLAQTILETFRAHGEPVSVLRIDGVNQRGESYKDPDCRVQGREYGQFVFSQGVRDVEASVDFMIDHAHPKRTILVSQSVAALSARKAIVRDRQHRVDGWISIVGSPDLQSVSRAISGGIDFAVGFENGISFGYQELLGVVIHADRLMRDAVEIGVLHLEDARRDFESIDIPLTWFHGEFDAWVNFDRVKEALSYGSRQERRLITIPTAHRLGWSRNAADSFLSVASEVARLATGRRLLPIRPDQEKLAARRAFERVRRPKATTNFRAFWKDYLLGRDGSIGIELMTACDPYASLMSNQIELLRLASGHRVLDLGCGTGSLATEIARAKIHEEWRVNVVGIDHVPEVLRRARRRGDASNTSRTIEDSWIAADLDVVAKSLEVPLADQKFDAVLASLVLSYIERPEILLSEMYRLLKPGGRVVVSSMLRDADISRLYVESVTELQISDAATRLPELGLFTLDSVARNFLNDASKILELEADGSFVFWEPDELAQLVKSAGFIGLETRVSFGNPGQAAVVGGYRPPCPP